MRKRLKDMVENIGSGNHRFFDRNGSLKCIDDEIMKAVLENVKNVENGDMEASPEVFKEVLPIVVQTMEVMMVNFQNIKVECSDVNIMVSSSPGHVTPPTKCRMCNPLSSSRCCSCCCGCCFGCCQSTTQPYAEAV
jgi:hypothetical protein